MRLIDANYLITQINNFKNECFASVGHDEAFVTLDKLIDGIQIMPTVDAVPVVHGHWIVIENDQNTDDRYKMQCSVCGETLWSIEPEELYCCKCGAKMDESTQSNDSNTLDALGEKVTE